MAGNTAEALRRIHENKLTRSKILDLSGLGLSELLEEWIPLEQVKQGSTQVVSTSGKVLGLAPFYSLINSSILTSSGSTT